MNTRDEISLEDHWYFRARLAHLEAQNPAALLIHLEQGTLTAHLKEVTAKAMLTKAELVINRKMPLDQADELVMSQVVADPAEQSHLPDLPSRTKLRMLLNRYKAALPDLPRTYLSQSEIIE